MFSGRIRLIEFTTLLGPVGFSRFPRGSWEFIRFCRGFLGIMERTGFVRVHETSIRRSGQQHVKKETWSILPWPWFETCRVGAEGQS